MNPRVKQSSDRSQCSDFIFIFHWHILNFSSELHSLFSLIFIFHRSIITQHTKETILIISVNIISYPTERCGVENSIDFRVAIFGDSTIFSQKLAVFTTFFLIWRQSNRGYKTFFLCIRKKLQKKLHETGTPLRASQLQIDILFSSRPNRPSQTQSRRPLEVQCETSTSSRREKFIYEKKLSDFIFFLPSVLPSSWYIHSI